MIKRGWLQTGRKWCFLALCCMAVIGIPAMVANAQDAPANAPAPGSESVDSDIPLAPEEKAQEEKRFSYNPHGMRDPFVSLLQAKQMEPRGEGVAGLKISELTLQGIQMGLGKVAIVLGADGNTYSLKVGDSVYDGKVIKITENKVVFEKIIFDAFGREKEKKSIEIYLHRG